MYDSSSDPAKDMFIKDDNGYYVPVNRLSASELSLAARDLHSTRTQDMLKRGYPTYEKCERILNWLTSNK